MADEDDRTSGGAGTTFARSRLVGAKYRQLAFMRDDWFERLITAFDKIVREHEVFVRVLGIP